MDNLTLVLVIILSVNLILTLWMLFINRRQKDIPRADSIQATLAELKTDIVSKQMEGLLSLRESLDNANRLINERLSEGTVNLDNRMKVINEIENKLGQLTIQTDNIEDIGKNIQSLSDLLKPPKLRGNLGELFLENLLAQILPSSLYERQYRFKDGQRVDAVVFLGDKVIPIDAKFPMESFKKTTEDQPDIKALSASIKKYIDDISSKYIRPDEKTTDIALMYIPAEAIYTEFVGHEETSHFEYALSKRVIPSSPGHLYGFLATISTLYMETALLKNNHNLGSSLTAIEESLAKLNSLTDRLNGSLRSASSGNEKCRKELQNIENLLENLKQFDATESN